MVQVVDAPQSTEPAATTETKAEPKPKRAASAKKARTADGEIKPPEGALRKPSRYKKLLRYLEEAGGHRVVYSRNEGEPPILIQLCTGAEE